MSAPTAARSSRSRSRSRSEATTLVDSDTSVRAIATIEQSGLLQTPQIAPGTRAHRSLAALDEKEARQLMRYQSIRHWWGLRGRLHNAGGVDRMLLKSWVGHGFPASPGGSHWEGIPLAGPAFNVVVDPIKEKALWDKWGRDTWMCIVASEEDSIVDKGYTFELSKVQFEFDRSLFNVPSSPFIGVVP